MALEAALYLGLTIVITWPLGRDLTTNVPGDYGDPLLVMWIMGWVMKQLTAMFTGDIAAIAGLWHAPIFFPERNTLALSEHHTGQALQALPVWWATGNLILSYNVVILLSFVLTALGTSVLVQEISGSRTAGVLAGVMVAFNPYRTTIEISHVQTLSIQWLPLALVGLHRFVRSGSDRALAFGAVCVALLNLCSVYYMLYCGPFIVGFTLADMAIQRKLTDRRVWLGLIVAVTCLALITVPFVLPYVNMQQQHGFERPLKEIIGFSATLDQYRAVLPWFGVIVLGGILSIATLWRRDAQPWRAYGVLFLVFSLLTFWLSLGPVVRAGGEPLGVPGLYGLLYTWVPGFTGLRAASRYGALTLVFLPAFAALSVAWLMQRRPIAGRLVASITAVVFLWQAWPSAFPINRALPSPDLLLPAAYLTPSPQLPPIYRAVAGLDPNAVLAELPFGDPWYELRYMFFAATHGRRLMNGYSGVFPASYQARQRRLADPLASPAAASDALGGATHVVVHERAWGDDTGPRIEAWLESLGAVLVAGADDAKLFALESLRRDARRLGSAR